jgi:hypothetical protein
MPPGSILLGGQDMHTLWHAAVCQAEGVGMHTSSKQRAVGICLVLGSILVLVALWDMPENLGETRSRTGG